MKKLAILFLFLCVSSGISEGFWTGEGIERDDIRVEIESVDDATVRVSVTEVLTNISKENQMGFVWYGVRSTTTERNVYANGNGKRIQEWSFDDAKKYVWRYAQDAKDMSLFRFVDPRYEIVALDPMPFEPGETQEIRFEYILPLDFMNDVFFAEVFLNDGKPTKNISLEANLNSTKPLRHVWSTMHPEIQQYVDTNTVQWKWEAIDVVMKKDFGFLFSQVTNPTVQNRVQGENFAMELVPFAPFDPQNMVLVVDTSGSMSGSSWIRAQDMVRELLNVLPVNQNIKLGLWQDKIKWHTEDFVPLNAANKAAIFEKIQNTQPVGTTNLDALDPALVQGDGVFLITDETEWKEPIDNMKPLVVLDLSASDTSDLQILARGSGGWRLRLYPLAEDFIEKNEFERAWKKWMEPWERLGQNMPRMWSSGLWRGTNMVLGKSDSLEAFPNTPFFAFLAPLWAQQQVAYIIEQPEIFPEDQAWAEDINTRYGLKIQDLENLITWPMEKKYEYVQNLQDTQMNIQTSDRALFDWGMFTKTADGLWKESSFDATMKPESHIVVQAFSEGHEKLYTLYPDVFLGTKGLSAPIDWCKDGVCVSLTINEVGVNGNELSFISDFEPNHWANGALAGLWMEDIFDIPENKIVYNTSSNRGDFVIMIAKAFFPQEYAEYTLSGKEIRFDDMREESPALRAVHLLSDKGIIRGYPDDTFRPDRALSRAEALKVILASKDWAPNVDVIDTRFVDVEGWSSTWVWKADKIGLAQGYEDGTFRPHQTLTVAEAGVLLWRGKHTDLKNKY